MRWYRRGYITRRGGLGGQAGEAGAQGAALRYPGAAFRVLCARPGGDICLCASSASRLKRRSDASIRTA